MANFSLTCTCGHTEILEASDRNAAVQMFRSGMTEQAINGHFRQYHKPGEPKPSVEQAKAMVTQFV
jgi:hypothetical protein